MRLRNTMAWPTRILHSIEIWPCYNVINDLGVTNNGQIICVACNKRNIVSRVILYGNTYNENTIENTQLDGRYSFDKVFRDDIHNDFFKILLLKIINRYFI